MSSDNAITSSFSSSYAVSLARRGDSSAGQLTKRAYLRRHKLNRGELCLETVAGEGPGSSVNTGRNWGVLANGLGDGRCGERSFLDSLMYRCLNRLMLEELSQPRDSRAVTEPIFTRSVSPFIRQHKGPCVLIKECGLPGPTPVGNSFGSSLPSPKISPVRTITLNICEVQLVRMSCQSTNAETGQSTAL